MLRSKMIPHPRCHQIGLFANETGWDGGTRRGTNTETDQEEEGEGYLLCDKCCSGATPSLQTEGLLWDWVINISC